MNINPFDLLKNAQKLQEQMGTFQEKLSFISATGSSGGGMVEVELNGKIEVIAVRIAPEAAGDTEMLQDLVTAAFSNALEKVKEEINKEMGAMAGGLGIPGLSGIPGFPGVS
ncbi:nucleoid-associated protein, YbaB/EbfC family [Spirochaetia bacterium]|nr:nucleoid-associated protein, YbaB/EbfC family [Spirochaetia bacterium]